MQGPEWFARKELIDAVLRNTGWPLIVPYSEDVPCNLVAIEEYPTANGPADYALFCDDLPLAVVEAKKVEVGPQNVLTQAQRYSKGFTDSPFDFNGYRVPFAYSTNGHQIWFRDLRNPRSRSRQVSKFHTPAALKEMLAHNVTDAENWLSTNPVNLPILRPYQKDAITSVEAALLGGRHKMLLAMATGTGKTLTTIALLYRLMRSGYAKRILFLVDRRALAAQAVLAFSRFETEEGLKFNQVYEVYSQRFQRGDFGDQKFDPSVLPESYLTTPNVGHAFVYVSTIQRMRINLFGLPQNVNWGGDRDDDRDANILDIPIHAFDVIVADECHRGYTSSEESKWRETLEHFDAIKIGLTATPAAHTIAYFERPVVFNCGVVSIVSEADE